MLSNFIKVLTGFCFHVFLMAIAFRVAEELRGLGFGTMLIKEVLRRVKELGFSHVTIGVEELKTANVRLYQRFGFAKC